MCVRRKVRCCSTKPRCSICVRKGDVCVYSLKRRPGPRVRYSSCMDTYNGNNNNPMTGAIKKYNTRRMSIEVLLGASSTHNQDFKRPCRTPSAPNGENIMNTSSAPLFPARVANHGNNNDKSPVDQLLLTKKTSQANGGNNEDTSPPVHQLSHAEKTKTFQFNSSMKIPDNMVDLMDDSEHLMPADFVKLEDLSTNSLESCTSTESATLLDNDHIEDEALDFHYGKFFCSLSEPDD